ncbi:MAG: TorF family putative porin [Gammaproteobacteria bacterium]|nr:TorF family putative porin [Gammaproteobacteria bacterium]
MLLVGCAACIAHGVAAAQPLENTLRLSVVAASDYKRNGLSQTNSRPAARFSGDFEHRSGFYAGGFVTNVDYAAETYRSAVPRDLQTNFYVGYLWRDSKWQANVSVGRYVYPSAVPSYNYTQTAINASYRGRYFFGITYSRKYLSFDRSALHYRIGTALPLPRNFEVGINAGVLRSNGRFDLDYSFWDIGVSHVIDRFALDLRYHDNTYGRTSVLGQASGDRWVFSVAYAISPRSRRPAGR